MLEFLRVWKTGVEPAALKPVAFSDPTICTAGLFVNRINSLGSYQPEYEHSSRTKSEIFHIHLAPVDAHQEWDEIDRQCDRIQIVYRELHFIMCSKSAFPQASGIWQLDCTLCCADVQMALQCLPALKQAASILSHGDPGSYG
ncbi:hypothetical protein NDU88_007383 [Pleurodeles waltl]|uniref:Uncharacterized protein n=1 Tax=Pleurodeles waltl TaxID=8319 RepID=A0AAV7SS47_PLEWA|nr:hypothetical protein NDU88_007383 [Pleurodeles waltl]